MQNTIFLILAAFLLSNKMNAQGETYALIVGIADYKNTSMENGDLRYTQNDALKFYDFLRSSKGGSVPKDNIAFLKNQSATKANIKKYLHQLFTKAKDSDRIIFYYTGHGIGNYIIPYDASKERNSFLSYGDLKAAFKNSRADVKLCIIDACFSNSLKTKNNNGIQRRSAETIDSNEQIAIMVSSQDYQTSREYRALKQGVFSYFLINGLEGRADKDRNKLITIAELHEYVYKNVKIYTQNQQIPHTFGRFPKDMPVLRLN
ncbi:MAG: caspase family protein [Bacteroidota bacterium]